MVASEGRWGNRYWGKKERNSEGAHNAFVTKNCSESLVTNNSWGKEKNNTGETMGASHVPHVHRVKISWKTAWNWAVKPRLSPENRVDLLLEYNNFSRNFEVLCKLSLSAAHRFAHYFQTPWISHLRAISDTARLQYDGKVVQPRLVQHHLEAAAQLTVTDNSHFCS